MSHSSIDSIRKRLVENVTMLWTLNEVPEQPKENKFECESDGTRQLTLERERQLADSFAFISASTDNMLRVMAVCVEEDSDKEGITIRLASNTGDLSSIKEELDGIAKTLETAALRVESRTVVRQILFRQIVMLDLARILSRLRSRHAARTRKTSGKHCLLVLLHKSVNDPSMKPHGKVAKAKLVKARSQSEQLLETFDQFEEAHDDHTSMLSIDILVDLLVQACNSDVENLQTALQTPSLISPSLKTFLPEAVRKLGRYYCVACDLVDAARSSSYTIFGRISIVALEQPVLDTSSSTGGPAGFDEVFQRITGRSHMHPRWRHLSRSLPAARTKFQSRMSNCATPLKVHAEIQLLFYYERNPDIPHPRTICSSKSACYLCDLFIKSHGKFHISRTHGRLYDRWMLPEWPEGQSAASERTFSVIDRFNTVLEAKILQTLHGARLPNHHPNESVLNLREPWSSTSTLSPAEPRARSAFADPDPSLRPAADSSIHAFQQPSFQPATDGNVHATQESSLEPATDSNVHAAQESSLEPATDSNVHATQEPSLEPATDSNVHATQEPSFNPATDSNVHATQEPSFVQETPILNQHSGERRTSASPTRPATSSEFLPRGDTMYRQLTYPSDSFIVQTDKITLHVSRDWPRAESSDHTTSARDSYWVQVRWLARGTQIAAGDEGYECVDLCTLDSDHDKIVQGGAAFGSKALCIKKGEHVLILQYSLEDPR